jgi:hypothetical protein
MEANGVLRFVFPDSAHSGSVMTIPPHRLPDMSDISRRKDSLLVKQDDNQNDSNKNKHL